MTIYDWKKEFTQIERQALIGIFKISRDVSKVKVVSVGSGVDVVEEDGVTDEALKLLDGYSAGQLKEIAASGQLSEPTTASVVPPVVPPSPDISGIRVVKEAKKGKKSAKKPK